MYVRKRVAGREWSIPGAVPPPPRPLHPLPTTANKNAKVARIGVVNGRARGTAAANGGRPPRFRRPRYGRARSVPATSLNRAVGGGKKFSPRL